MPETKELDQNEPATNAAGAAIPVIDARDLESPAEDDVIRQVRDACRGTGFFFIEPTPEQSRLMASARRTMQAFFSIDDLDPVKQAVLCDESRRGWRPRFTEPAYQPDTISTLEAFDVGVGEIDGPRDWWPAVDGFRNEISQCWHLFLHLGDAVLESIAIAADLAPGFFRERCDARSLNSLRLLNYAGDRPLDDERTVGISAHTDFECITLLSQDRPGLELRTVGGQWIDAADACGKVVVMIDDMMERWTNGWLQATGHRVRETDEQRFSIVMFMAVNDGIRVSPLDRFVSKSTPAGYEATTQDEHLDREIRRARENAAALAR